jgi:DNA-binding NarL/FixJ family response regulator
MSVGPGSFEANESPLRIVVVADDPLVRAGLTSMLERDPACRVAGQAEPAADLSTDLDAFRPDVLVWDLGWESDVATMPGLEAAIERDLPVLALIDGPAQAGELWARGVRGLLARDAGSQKLLAAARSLTQGLVVMDPAFADQGFALSFSPQELDEPLTPREVEVLGLIAEGLSNRAIAGSLGISEHTVKFHVTSVMAKLDAQSRTEAVVRATRLGLLSL